MNITRELLLPVEFPRPGPKSGCSDVVASICVHSSGGVVCAGRFYPLYRFKTLERTIVWHMTFSD